MIIFMVDGEPPRIFVQRFQIWVIALWSQVDWNGISQRNTPYRDEMSRALLKLGEGNDQKI